MPDFPRYNSTGQMTTQKPQPDAPADAEGAVQAQLAKTFQSAQDSVVIMAKAQQSMQDTQAEINFKTPTLKTMADAEESTDINGYERSAAEIDKNLAQSGARPGSEMFLKLKYEADAAKITLKGLYHKKQIINDNVNTEAELELLSQNPTVEGYSQIAEKVDAKQKLGFYKEDAAADLKIKYQKKWRNNKFINDLNEDPASAEKKLTKNEYGFTVEEHENAGKIYDREIQVIRNQTEESFIDMQNKGDLSEKMIIDARDKKKIDANFAKSMIKDLRTVPVYKAEALESVTGANIVAEKFKALKDKEWAWKSASFEERSEFRASVFDARRKGYINDEELDLYLGETSNKFYSSPEFTNALQSVFDTSKEYVSKEKKSIAQQQMTKALMSKVMGGTNPKVALNQVVLERIGADYPGVDPENLMFTAKKRGLKVWQVYNLVKPTGEKNAD